MRIISFYLVVACICCFLGCKTVGVEGTTRLDLTLQSSECVLHQGGVTFKLRLANKGNANIAIRWFAGNIPNNFGVLVRPANARGEGFDDSNPLNSGVQKDLVLKRGDIVDTDASFICDLQPGDYEICLVLTYYPDVRTEWHKIRVLPGRKIDTRK